MVIIEHKASDPLRLLNSKLEVIHNIKQENLVSTLITVANSYPNDLIIWCETIYIKYLNIDEIESIFHHKRILASFNPNATQYLPNSIGYIERSFFLKVNKNVSYPTWLMSSMVGGVHASLINHLKMYLKIYADFDYLLNSIGKLGMADGLFCYSEPKLLKSKPIEIIKISSASTYTLFKFVKQHYKWIWTFFLALCIAINEKKIKLLPLFRSLFYSRLPIDLDLQNIIVQSSKKVLNKPEIDVIIPTIGRKAYLYEILKDFSDQTLIPKNVIIVEQNPLADSVSELDYLINETWKFKIKHIFTNRTGVCNARNLALDLVESEWAFLADDDIRISNTFFEDSLKEIEKYGITVLNYLCLQPQQKQDYFKTHQTSIFGSGSSMVKSEALNGLSFDKSYEFGFGEDSDFGMQLRNKGQDVIFIPNIKITHLKAPIGGYRTKIEQLWEDDIIQPKPSPTIQLLHQRYFTSKQNFAYKLLLFILFYNKQKTKNPFRYKSIMQRRWSSSLKWSEKIAEKSNA